MSEDEHRDMNIHILITTTTDLFDAWYLVGYLEAMCKHLPKMPEVIEAKEATFSLREAGWREIALPSGKSVHVAFINNFLVIR